MVKNPSDYAWSSYQCNGLGKHSDLLTAHPTYLSINDNVNMRQANYRALFTHHVESKLIEEIRLATNKGLALGNDEFKLKVEALSGTSVIEGKRGRPKGWKKELDVSN
jgi:putative transposase